MEDIQSVIERHLGSGGVVKVRDSEGRVDELKIKSLEIGDMGKVVGTLDLLESANEGVASMLKKLSQERIEEIAKLGVKMLKPNYPTINDKTLENIVAKNILSFLMVMWKQTLNLNMEVKNDKTTDTGNNSSPQEKEDGKRVHPKDSS